MPDLPQSLTGLSDARPRTEPHDHAVFPYADAGELKRAVGVFFKAGIAQNELCVFVHGFATDADAWDFLHQALPDFDRLRERAVVVVSFYQTAFEKGGRIDHPHVASVVDSLVGRAKGEGLAGTRIFVDASRHYFDGGRREEWFAFEEWLGRRLLQSSALVCAYRRDDLADADIMAGALRTHAYRFDARGA